MLLLVLPRRSDDGLGRRSCDLLGDHSLLSAVLLVALLCALCLLRPLSDEFPLVRCYSLLLAPLSCLANECALRLGAVSRAAALPVASGRGTDRVAICLQTEIPSKDVDKK
jgi:hypothetical protein